MKSSLILSFKKECPAVSKRHTVILKIAVCLILVLVDKTDFLVYTYEAEFLL